MDNQKIIKILTYLNKIIESNSEKINFIYGFVKLFNPKRLTTNSLQEKTEEITNHYQKSTELRSMHGRSLGKDQTELSAIILAGFDLNLYSCEFVDIATGKCVIDYESDLVKKKDNDYLNMILHWYKIKEGGLSDDDILEILNSQYQICVSKASDNQSRCVISG
jgi:hypothetical protein